MWQFVDQPWQYRVLDQLPPGVDLAQLAAAREMTPTQRLEAAQELVRLGEELRRAVFAKRAEK